MPLYEYICETDGTVIELLRPISDAEKPVKDPKNRGRVFKRKLSTFAAPSPSGAPPSSGCCPCGKPRGSCRSN